MRTIFPLLVIAAALAAPVYAQESAKPNESPWAMRPPTPQAAPTISAQERAAQKGTPEQRKFAHRVANAMVDKDSAAIKQLIAPSTLKCIGAHQDFLHDRIRKQFELPMNRKFELTITKLPPNLLHNNKYSTYPMPPTHLMGMKFNTENGTAATVNLPIGQEDGKWYEAQPCPTDLGLERFAKLMKMRAERRERAKAAMAQIKDPLKSQLAALIGKRDDVGAWRLCMSSLHLDFPTCRGIVEIMSGNEAD